MKKVLITGAAGNLGGLLAVHLMNNNLQLNLLTHKKDVANVLKNKKNIAVFRADLADKKSLKLPLENVDTIVHFAGILFKNNPEKFLPVTNTKYFNNLLEVAVESGVKRIILISFPHVEGETFPDKPAKGLIDNIPISAHATTRLEEEKLLFEMCTKKGIEPVSLRLGMVYGKGILMIDTARWFSKYCILGIWKNPTYIHLISTEDYLNVTEAAITKEGISGIYHIGDEGIQTLQEFLDEATTHWKTYKPVRMPIGLINLAARVFETWSWLTGCRSPLTVDFVKLGMVSYYGNTRRMKEELLPELKYKTFREGIDTL